MKRLAILIFLILLCAAHCAAPSTFNPSDPASDEYVDTLLLQCLLGSCNGSGANGDASGTNGPSTVSAINPSVPVGIQLWLKADSLALANSTPVNMWNDSSGKGNNASQGTGVNQPAFMLNVLNSNPVVQFNSTNQHFMIMPEFMSFSSMTFFLVGKASGTTGASESFFTDRGAVFNETFQILGNTSGTTGGFFRDSPGGTIGLGSSGSSTTPFIISFTISSLPSIIGYYNGLAGTEQNTAYTSTTFAGNQAPPNIGRTEVGATHYLNGYIAEIIVYSTVMSDDQRRGIECYLSNKYGISLSFACAP